MTTRSSSRSGIRRSPSLGCERLETRDNPSWASDAWDWYATNSQAVADWIQDGATGLVDYPGEFASGVGQGFVNVFVKPIVRTVQFGHDVVAVGVLDGGTALGLWDATADINNPYVQGYLDGNNTWYGATFHVTADTVATGATVYVIIRVGQGVAGTAAAGESGTAAGETGTAGGGSGTVGGAAGETGTASGIAGETGTAGGAAGEAGTAGGTGGLPTYPQQPGVGSLPQNPLSQPLGPQTPPGTYVFAQEGNGIIRVVPDGPHLHPTVLGGGQEAAAAGEIVIDASGAVVEINNISFTFQLPPNTLDGVVDAIVRLGLQIRPNAVKPFVGFE
jgi:hypothetical protein